MRRLYSIFILCVLLVIAYPASATDPVPSEEQADIFQGLSAVLGPAGVNIGKEGQLDVPAGYAFFNAQDTQVLLERMENIVGGDELGMIAPHDFAWLAVFSYDPVGYVEDSGENARIDAEAILESYKKGVQEVNKQKRDRGWSTSSVVGWSVSPHYNKTTNNLEWAIRFRSDDEGDEYDNYNVRILGREGVMEVIVAGPTDEETLSAVRQTLTGYSFVSGRTHAEYRQGDKLAGYGLAALIGGGVAAAAVKSGLLQKFLKPILLAVGAVAVGVVNLFRKRKK